MRHLGAEEAEISFLRLNEFIAALERLWDALLPCIERPDRRQFFMWMKIHHDLEIVRRGIEKAAHKNKRDGLKDADHAVRYASKCMNSFAADRKALREIRQIVESRNAA